MGDMHNAVCSLLWIGHFPKSDGIKKSHLQCMGSWYLMANMSVKNIHRPRKKAMNKEKYDLAALQTTNKLFKLGLCSRHSVGTKTFSTFSHDTLRKMASCGQTVEGAMLRFPHTLNHALILHTFLS